MPPKRKRNAEATQQEEASQTRKRQTRSVTKRIAQGQDETLPIPPPPTKPRQSTKSKTPNSKGPKSKATKRQEATPIPSQPSQSTPGVLSLTHPTLKNPVHAELYAPNQQPSASNSNPSPTLIFTHGAGGDLSTPAIVHFRTGYTSQLPILLFKGSMNLPSRVKGFSAALSYLDSHSSSSSQKGGRRVLGGRSMGSRAAIMTALDTISNAGNDKDKKRAAKDVDLVLVSYPLISPKGETRDQPLLDLPGTANVLFIIGSRDSMCPTERLMELREKMLARSWLVVVEGLDHGMHGKQEEMLGTSSGEVAAKWVRDKKVELLEIEEEYPVKVSEGTYRLDGED
ncbi:hypothetical protein M011DRAFT_465206 [Sporormia fimetaria CBS 119925]|uniref:KANL3/Tex30 alpha/beta hydrolase-like domain-containing protein n=1 Tax=Sporormia fimetaria CBS 119925 TaxID=1340428 RepID=A0A6A6VIN3_9PLEO|nr:hypothetical protein M011DRAFT_465206 [Sporormia fimetaria CBS 119925]